MLNILEIVFLNTDTYSQLCKHIQYNLLHKLGRKPFFGSIKRITIHLELSDGPSTYEIVRDNGQICILKGVLGSLDGDISGSIALSVCDMLIQLRVVKEAYIQSILTIKEEIESGNLVVDIPFFKKVYDKQKRFSAEVVCRYLPEYVQFVFRCLEGKECYFEAELSTFRINPFLFNLRYSRLYFADNCFIVEDQFQEIQIVFSILEKVLQTVYSPKTHTLEELLHFDKSMDYLVANDDFQNHYIRYVNK